MSATQHSHGRGDGDAWAGYALERLDASGFKRGGARRAVIDVLAAEPCAISALAIEERLRKGRRRVGRASIYRALEQLTELRLVQRLDLGGDTAAYERSDPGGEHHHHMVCDECGRVEPFSDERLERAMTKLEGGSGFEVRDHEVVLHGACERCR